jgi:hypothetical protein
MPWKECNRMDERLRFVAKLWIGVQNCPDIMVIGV